MCTNNFQMYKLDLEKSEEMEIKFPMSTWSSKKQGNARKTSTSASLTKAFDYVDHNKLENLRQMGIPDHLTYLLRKLYAGKKQQLEPGMEQWTGSRLGKECIKAVYCHPNYLAYMQSTSCKMPGWMKHKLESRLPGEISIISDKQMTPPL